MRELQAGDSDPRRPSALAIRPALHHDHVNGAAAQTRTRGRRRSGRAAPPPSGEAAATRSPARWAPIPSRGSLSLALLWPPAPPRCAVGGGRARARTDRAQVPTSSSAGKKWRGQAARRPSARPLQAAGRAGPGRAASLRCPAQARKPALPPAATPRRGQRGGPASATPARELNEHGAMDLFPRSSFPSRGCLPR